MEQSARHAKAFDIPGWPSPPRVRDIPDHKESWGWIPVASTQPVVAQDELGFLWVDGANVPVFRLPDESHASPGGVVFWATDGVGLWIHPKSRRYLGTISRLDMEQDRWIPVREVVDTLPLFVQK